MRDDDGRLVDAGTGSVWDSVTGEAIAGPLQGTVLDQLPVTRAFWFAWSSFFPNTQVVD